MLDAITAFYDREDRAPTIREIGKLMEISSTNGVNDHLKALERKECIVRLEGTTRCIRPLLRSDGRPFCSRADLKDEVRRLQEENARLRSGVVVE